MAGGGKVRIADADNTSMLARVVNGRLLVSSTGGGGGGGAVDITAVGGNPIGATVPVSGTVTANQGTSPWVVSGTVAVSNFPATQAVTQSTSPWVVSGTVAVSNFPATQPVSGTVTANQGTSPWVVSGTVAVSNFPATQAVTQSTSPWVVSGTVAVSNFPATQPVSGTVTANQGTSPWVVSGTVAATQSGAWTVGIGGQPIQVANPVTSSLLLSQSKIEDGDGGGQLVAVRVQGDGWDTARDAGLAITLPSTALPMIDGVSTPKTNGAEPLYTDLNGNLSTSSFIRGRATSAQRVLDIVNEEEAWNSGPFQSDLVRGALVAGISFEDPPAETALVDGNFSLLATDLQRRLWIRKATKRTYRAATPTYLQTGGATNAMFFVISGSASRTVVVQRVRATGFTTVGGEYGEVVCEKWSTAPTGGTPVVLTRVPLDSINPAATVNLCQVYTAAPAEGALIGPLGVRRDMFQPITINVSSPLMCDMEWDFRTLGENHGVTLRGVAQCLSLACGTLPSGAFLVSVEVEWTEE